MRRTTALSTLARLMSDCGLAGCTQTKLGPKLYPAFFDPSTFMDNTDVLLILAGVFAGICWACDGAYSHDHALLPPGRHLMRRSAAELPSRARSRFYFVLISGSTCSRARMCSASASSARSTSQHAHVQCSVRAQIHETDVR